MLTSRRSRGRMEQALTFHQIVDGISALITVQLADGEVALVNQHVLNYVGKSIDQLERLTAADLVHPDDLPRVVATWEQSVGLGEPYEFEHRLRRADGAYRWVQVRGLPVRDAAGRILRWFVLHTDIHERKLAEALLEGERRLLEMVASGGALHVVLDALCRVVEEMAGGYCGILVIDSSGTRFQRVVAPSLPSSYFEAKPNKSVQADAGPCGMAAATKTEVIVPDVASETRWDPDTWRSVALAHGLRACWSAPIVSRGQQVLGTFALYQGEPGAPDPFHHLVIQRFAHIASIAMERARGEEALRRSEGFLAEAQHLNRTGSFWWRATTDELTWSKEMYRIYEFDESEPLTFDRAHARVHPDDRALYMEHVARARREPVEADFDLRLRFPDGSVKHLHTVSHGSKDESGSLEYTGAVQDITERRRAEDALARLQSELAHAARVTTIGALTASIAHEVSQPLSGVITNASTCLRMLADDPPNLEGARETARRTIRDGRRATDVIARLRALFAKQETTAEPVDLNDAIHEVLGLSQSELQRSRVILRTELGDALPLVTGDRIQLQQVILNLLLNASQAMCDVDDRPRELMVRTERDDDRCVRFTVRDAGVGFDPEYTDRLFETFYTTKSGGMGIGLSVSRIIVEHHGGHLCANHNEGPGSTFAFSIPCRSETVPDARGPDAIRAAAVRVVRTS